MTRIAVTGTPGCGKTTLCGLLAAQGRTVVTVAELAQEHGAVLGRDDADDADVLDMERLADASLPADAVVDGHLSHRFGVDVVWLIRCDPHVLQERMAARGYRPGKIEENCEAEAMDLILQEAMAAGIPVVQRDGTRRSPEELLSAFTETEGKPLKDHDLEDVDWSDWLLR